MLESLMNLIMHQTSKLLFTNEFTDIIEIENNNAHEKQLSKEKQGFYSELSQKILY